MGLDVPDPVGLFLEALQKRYQLINGQFQITDYSRFGLVMVLSIEKPKQTESREIRQFKLHNVKEVAGNGTL